MDNSIRRSYQQLQIDENTNTNLDSANWKFLKRQILVSSGVWSNFFMFGLCLGTPTIYIAQVRREANSTEAISTEMSSWISSTPGYSAIPNVLILACISKYFGQKTSFLVSSVISAIGFIVLYLSTSVLMVIISEVMQGTLIACDVAISLKALSEYTSPRYRGVMFTIKSATLAWGVLVANTIGTFFHWKSISILGLACSVYSLLTGLLWPESPQWLAHKQNYDACAQSHCWLKGTSDESMRELKTLLTTQQDLITTKLESPPQSKVSKFIKICLSKTFYRPLGCAILLKCLYNFSGKLSCNVYALQLIKHITNNESTAYTGMFIIDLVTVCSMYAMSVIIRYYGRKTLLFCTTLVGVIFLMLMSSYLYCEKLGVINENNYVFLVLLTGYMIAISCGPIALSQTMVPELRPLRYSELYFILLSLIGISFMGTLIKMLPFLMKVLGSHGLFLFYGSSSLFLIILIYYFIPETKDTTVFDIDKLMRR